MQYHSSQSPNFIRLSKKNRRRIVPIITMKSSVCDIVFISQSCQTCCKNIINLKITQKYKVVVNKYANCTIRNATIAQSTSQLKTVTVHQFCIQHNCVLK